MSRGPSCSWCVSPFRQVAEEAIAAGRGIGRVSTEYGLPYYQWRNHRKHADIPSRNVAKPEEAPHVRLVDARRDALGIGGGPHTVIPRLEQLLIDVAAAKEKWQDKPTTIVQLLRLERDVLNDIAKLRGEFPERRSMNVGEWEEWHRVVDALIPFPKAQHAVSLALMAGDRR